MMGAVVEKARAAWGAELPDWVLVLAEACDASNQTRVAKRIGRSAATVSGVLDRKYPGNMETTEALIRGSLMGQTIECPVLGEVATNVCVDARTQQKLSTGSPSSVRLWRACPTCPHNPAKEAL